MDGDEEVGYHKGSLEALINERNELSRLIQIVDSFIESHAKALKQKGIDVESFIDELTEKRQQRQKQVQKAQKKAQQQAATGKQNQGSQHQHTGTHQSQSSSGHERDHGGKNDAPSRGKQRTKPQRKKNRSKKGRSEGGQEEVEIDDWWED